MTFKNLPNNIKNSLKTLAFYLIYVSVTIIFFYTLPGGAHAPGPDAILILLAPFVVGIFTVINLVRVFQNREHSGSLVIHFSILIVLLILIYK